MREVKFQFVYKGPRFHSKTEEFNWHKKVYSLDQLLGCKLSNLCDVHNTSTFIAKRQFTGLIDSGGVDIYEGDIVRHEKGYVWTVIFEDDESRFALKCKAPLIRPLFKDRALNLEVIGNIYENPDLLS